MDSLCVVFVVTNRTSNGIQLGVLLDSDEERDEGASGEDEVDLPEPPRKTTLATLRSQPTVVTPLTLFTHWEPRTIDDYLKLLPAFPEAEGWRVVIFSINSHSTGPVYLFLRIKEYKKIKSIHNWCAKNCNAKPCKAKQCIAKQCKTKQCKPM